MESRIDQRMTVVSSSTHSPGGISTLHTKTIQNNMSDFTWNVDCKNRVKCAKQLKKFCQ